MRDEDCGWVLIENPGVVGKDLLTVVGASGSRGDADMIGMFGSGFKYSIALLLRKNCAVRLYIGLDGFEFGTDERVAKDVRDRDVEISEVVMQQVSGSSRKKTRLGFDVNFGVADWDDAGMAAREFISNAADASWLLNGSHEGCVVRYVSEEMVRAKAGSTRVFIQMNSEVREFVRDINKHFLIFDRHRDKTKVLVEKKSERDPLRVYRKGVLVYEGRVDSLYDYNFGEELSLKESRVISESDARMNVSLALKHASAEELRPFFEALHSSRDVFEVTHSDPWAMRLQTYESAEVVGRVSKNWNDAFVAVFGENGVVCDTDFAREGVERKGYAALKVGSSLRGALASFRLKTADSVLSAAERKGREVVPLTAEQFARMERVWRRLERLGITNGREMPKVEGFVTIMSSGSLTLATASQRDYDADTDTVSMSTALLDDKGYLFVQAAIEEYAHAVTQARDETRDLQTYAFQVAAMMMVAEGI